MRRRLWGGFAGCLVLMLGALAGAQPPMPPPPGASPAPPAAPAAGNLTVDQQKAVEFIKQGKIDDAYKTLDAAYKANPKLTPPGVQMASLFFQAREGRAARQFLETAAKEDPKHPEVYLLNASFALSEGRLTDTILSCQIAQQLAVDPRWDPEQRQRFVRESRLGLASAFEARRDFNAARDQLAAVLAEDPKNGIARSRMAVATFLMGKPEEAFAEFSAAFRDDPAIELPELSLAGLYSNQSDLPKAEEWYKRAVAVHGNNVKSHRAYAGWLLDQGKVDEAQLYIDTAAKLDPNSRETLALRGLSARYRKDYATAETLFDSILRENPANTFAALNLALSLVETLDKKKQQRGLELAENEARKNSQNPETLAILGWCLYKNGQLDNAERALLGANQASQRSGQGLSRDGAYFIARVLFDRSKFEDAQKILTLVKDASGAFVYRAEAIVLMDEVAKRVPPMSPPPAAPKPE